MQGRVKPPRQAQLLYNRLAELEGGVLAAAAAAPGVL